MNFKSCRYYITPIEIVSTKTSKKYKQTYVICSLHMPYGSLIYELVIPTDILIRF